MRNLLFILIVFVSASVHAQTGIGTTTPNSSARLDVTSTNKGFLPPRMTTSQRNAISSPAKGLMIFNTDTNNPDFYNGSSWTTKVDYYIDNLQALYTNTYFNNSTYGTASAANYVGNSITLAKRYGGFERVNDGKLKNVSGRTVTVKIDIDLFVECTNITSNKFDVYVYFGINDTEYSKNIAGYQLEANSKWQSVRTSAVITLSNNDYFDIRIASAGGWTLNVSRGSITIIEI